MPTPYINNDVPPTAPYKWVPDIAVTGGEVPTGFNDLTILRGEFRNDLPPDARWPHSITLATSGQTSPSGSEKNPFLRAFRILQAPSVPIGAVSSQPALFTGNDFSYEITLGAGGIPISAITLDYALTIDYRDPKLLPLLSASDQKILKIWLKKSDLQAPPAIAWSSYALCRIVGVDGAGKETTYPFPGKSGKLGELLLTDFTPKTNALEPAIRTATVTFAAGSLPDNYPRLSKLRLDNPHKLATLSLSIYRLMLFNAAAVNIRPQNLPCSLFEYAYPVSFNFDAKRGTSIWPDSGTTPNFHLKVFHPDSITGSAGMAHSLSLRFLIFALPIYGLAPADYSSLAGALSAAADPGAYMAVFVGPVAGHRTLQYALLPLFAQKPGGVAVRLDAVPVAKGATSLILQRAGSEGSSAPDPSGNWNTLGTYPIASPAFVASGSGFIAPYLYFDGAGIIDKTWYRITTLGANHQPVSTSAFRGEIAAEKGALAAGDSSVPTGQAAPLITRRVPLISELTGKNPLNAPLLALFVATQSDALASPLTFGAGLWRLSFRALCSNPDLVNVQIFARIWFVPDGETIDVAKIQSRRALSEFYFVSDVHSNSMTQGTPPSLDNLLVSSPLTSTITQYELSRYMDKLNSGDGATFTIPFGANVLGRLAIGFYAAGSLTEAGTAASLTGKSANLPSLTLEMDSQYASLLTTIKTVTSHALFPTRANIYTSSAYVPLSAPLTAIPARIGGAAPASSSSGYPAYSGQYKAASSSSSSSGNNATLNLITLASAGTAAAFVLSYGDIASAKGGGAGDYVDFATNGINLSAGRIGPGAWTIALTLNRNAADTPLIGCDFRVEAFLGTLSGLITERIFRSPLLDGLPATGSSAVNFTQAITLPFAIGGDNAQFILRIWKYPYSRSGKAVNAAAVTASLGGVPFGARVDSLVVSALTAQYLSVNQGESRLGSPAFYEDLPLVPSQSLGGQDFWYHSSAENQKLAILVGPDYSWPISGCLYSPAFYLNLPSDMEARAFGAGLNTGTGSSNSTSLWYRTVLSSGAGTERAVTAYEDPHSGTIHVAQDVDENTVSAQSSGFRAQSLTGRKIRHYSFSSPFSAATTQEEVAGLNGGSSQVMEGKYPQFYPIRASTGNSASPPSGIGLIAQTDDGKGNSFTTALSMRGASNGRWLAPERSLSENNFSAAKNIASGLSYPAFAMNPQGVMGYALGVAGSGHLIMRELTPYDAGQSEAEGAVYIIEGDKSIALSITPSAPPLFPSSGLNGSVNATFAGIMADKNGYITVAYSLAGQDGDILARTVKGKIIGAAYVIATFNQAGMSAHSNLQVGGVALTYHEPTHCAHASFWCGGKIWTVPFDIRSNVNSSLLSIPQLVAGNRDFTDASNSANVDFAGLLGLGAIRSAQEGDAEADVPSQRPGVFVSDKAPFQGKLFVYYIGASGDLRFRQIASGGITTAPVLVSNF